MHASLLLLHRLVLKIFFIYLFYFDIGIKRNTFDVAKKKNFIRKLSLLNNRFVYFYVRRPRRRSGSSIVVVDDEPVKHLTPEEQDAEDALNMMMTMLDNGPHRELPVDVPESFIAINKTPPRYPPPSRVQVSIL